ncbi:MAG: hypothetical protein AB1695_11925 [Stygiobacter sp.]
MKYKIYLFTLTALLFVNCADEILNPPTENYGIKGRIMDESGNSISGVKVYYLFNYSYLPKLTTIHKLMNKNDVDSFGYALYQNFPNPVYNSSFIRYSLAADMNIELTVKEDFTGKVKYTNSGFNSYGLYQYHFNEIVNSLQLENGSYTIILKVSKNGTLKYEAKKKMFVISDIGKPNSLSDKNGQYFIDYKKACIGDTLLYSTDGEHIFPDIINNYVNLLFKKDGFLPEIISTRLYSSVLLNRDVILKSEQVK